ncbi:MAG: hypothetical protein AAB339_01070 [Elusimicrobiota bacterium]
MLRAAAGGLCAAVAGAFTACARVEGGSEPSSTASSAASDPRVRVVVESTQATYEGLRVGVGYVRDGVAGLWLFFRDDPAKNTKIDVRAGQKVEVGGYSFTVEEVSGGMKGSVRLRFESSPGK